MVLQAASGLGGAANWTHVGQFAIAFALSAAIGLERELKQKDAGIRTYTLVGFASALFVLVSKYGFTDVLRPGSVEVDPSRVAAQVVSGLGFIGGGIIFVKRDTVRGLTTAASIWLTAAIGAAAGSGLILLALLGTAAHFIAILLLPPVAHWFERHWDRSLRTLCISYLDGRGLLRDVLRDVTQYGFTVVDLTSDRPTQPAMAGPSRTQNDVSEYIEVRVQIRGHGDLQSLREAISSLHGVLTVALAQGTTEPGS